MKTTTCPLNSQALSEPLENLSAEEARKCVKVFDTLPYSPAEANAAREVAVLISEHARLGFGEVEYSGCLSDKLIDTLKSKGFRVCERWLVTHHLPSGRDSFYSAKQRLTIQWALDIPEPPLSDWSFASHGDFKKWDELRLNAIRERLIQP